jgi:hypothetical protein
MSSEQVVRVTQIINGKPVLLEALLVSRDRWRARIARPPGGTTAVMPFYGSTADDAVQQLACWLTRVAGKRS